MSAPRETTVLAERETAGHRVELRWLADGRTAILVEDGPYTRAAFVPHAKALDAFHHPYCYLPQRP